LLTSIFLAAYFYIRLKGMLCSDSDDSGFENVSEEDLIEDMPPGER